MHPFERWLLGRHAADVGQGLSRARLLIWFSFCLAVISTGWVALALLHFHLPSLALVCFAGLALFVALLAWARGTASLRGVSIAVLAVCHLMLLGGALTSTGASALINPWIAVVVLLSAYLVDGRAGLVSAGAIGLMVLGLFGLEHLGAFHPPDPRFHEMAGYSMGPALISLAITAGMGSFYRRMLDHELEAKLRAEAELGKTQRLESMGSLVAGIAHEINNPLSFIRTNVEWIDEQLASPHAEWPVDECRQALAETAEGVDRVRRIVADLKAFSRETDEAAEWCSVRDAVAFALKLAGSLVRHTARVTIDIPADLQVEAPRSRLGQVLLNLITNAAQAIAPGERNSNDITVWARLGPEGCTLEVRDTGHGIAAEHLHRVFDPFFTTKPVGEGTGLGLSVSLGIVQRFGGQLSIGSVVGQGTVVTMQLPRARAAPRTDGTDPKAARVALPAGMRVLVLDDEPAIGRSIARLLKGVDVTIESNGVQALERCAKETFDLVLCDVMMPHMSGARFLDHLCALWPDANHRLVFMTGGALDADSRSLIERCPVVFKPLDEQTLRSVVLGHAG